MSILGLLWLIKELMHYVIQLLTYDQNFAEI